MNYVPLRAAFAAPQLPDFKLLSIAERLEWAASHYPGTLALTSSFGIQSVLMIDHLYQSGLMQEVPVVTLDIPGPAWDDQRAYRKVLQELYGFDLHVFPAYNEADKARALEEGLARLDIRATIDGIRAAQTENRSAKSFIETKTNGRTAIHPVLDWPDARTDWYIENLVIKSAHHPAWKPGSRSHGGVVLRPGEEKTECPLHI